ncbi:MAG: cytochrome c [Cyclobacteriaceae bacterium]|nr:cytochrome c [Cyclobacteriaceae bacterium]
MNLLKSIKSAVVLALGVAMVSCAGVDNPGLEYAPNMYHSVAYEPLKQITDENAGDWVQMDQENSNYGEYYSSNPLNPNRMNMRTPPANTIARGKSPYRVAKDDLDSAANVISPYPEGNEAILKDGKVLYEKFCDHCHGKDGITPGKVGDVFLGVPAYNSAAIKDKPEGHVFHVITHGKGRMGAHASQLSVDERWRIARYVQKLQKQ